MLVASGPAGVSMTLTKIKYRTQVAPFSGTATMEVTAATRPEPVLDHKLPFTKKPDPAARRERPSARSNSAPVTFENLQIDQTNLATAGVITVRGSLGSLEVSGGPVTDQAGTCGTDLTLEPGATITKTTPGEVTATGPMTAELPYRDDKGKRAAFANFEQNQGTGVNLLPKDPHDRMDTIFELHDTGQLRLHLSGARATPDHPGDFDLAGFNFRPETLDLDLPSGGTPSTLTVSIPSGIIRSPLPGLITQDDKPLQLKATGIHVNAAGQPSFNKATVSTSNISLAPAIPLVRPLDFALLIHQAEVAVKDGVIAQFKLTEVDLVLPERLNPYPTPGSVTVKLTNSGSKVGGAPPLDLLNPQQMARIEFSAPLQLNFAEDPRTARARRFRHLPPKYHSLVLAPPDKMFLDLSSEGPANADKIEPGVGGPAWQGLFFENVSVDTLAATNFFADGFGVTGVATAEATQEIGDDDGPKYKLVNVVGGESFRRSELVSGGGYTGELEFPAEALARIPPEVPSKSTLTVRGAYSGDASPTLVVDPQQNVTIKKRGMLHLNIAAGTFTSGRLLLAGILDFPTGELNKAGAAFLFQDLPLTPEGDLDPPGGVLQFAQPTDVDLGTFKLQATGLAGFGPAGGDLRLDGAMDIACPPRNKSLASRSRTPRSASSKAFRSVRKETSMSRNLRTTSSSILMCQWLTSGK